VHNIVLAFWETEEMPTEWETGLLKILPKKGDKSDPANYRGIMLLEVAYKIVANIVHMRLQVILESQVWRRSPPPAFSFLGLWRVTFGVLRPARSRGGTTV